jgi:hypothetical protein
MLGRVGAGLLRSPAVGRLLRAVRRDCFLALPHRGIDPHGRVGRNDRGVLGPPFRDDRVLRRSDAFRLPPVTTASGQAYHDQCTCEYEAHVSLRVTAPALSRGGKAHHRPSQLQSCARGVSVR